jgi:hypothetical protein
MTRFLYWLVYHFDLGPLGPHLLDFAVQNWLRRASKLDGQPVVPRQARGLFTMLHLRAADEGM